MEVARLLEKKEPGRIYGLMGNIDIRTNHKDIGMITSYRFNKTVSEYLNSSKEVSALKMVMQEESIRTKTIMELSEEQIKAVNLAKNLIEKKDYLVFDYFEKGFNHQEKENYKRLFRKLTKEYNKTILLFTNDITFLWDVADEIMLVDNDNVINIEKDNYFKILDFIDKPEISKMIDLLRKKKIKIEDEKDTKDLLKAIYRIKGE